MEERKPICTECDCEAAPGTFYGDPHDGPVIHKAAYFCIHALKEQRDRLQQQVEYLMRPLDEVAGKGALEPFED